jgi:hypothetical protein
MLHIGNGANRKIAHIAAQDKPEMKQVIIIPWHVDDNTLLAFSRKAENESNNDTGKNEKSFVFQIVRTLDIINDGFHGLFCRETHSQTYIPGSIKASRRYIWMQFLPTG